MLAPRRSEGRHAPGTPYVGLVPYGEGDADLFFGRDEEKQIVIGNLRAARLTIIYGPSGVGKTSLLRAGVLHDLREQVLANVAANSDRAPFAVCAFSAWRDDPLPALIETIGASVAEAIGDQPPSVQLGQPPVELLREWTKRVRTLLVVLDQFEDYFLYHPDEDGAGTLAAELPRILGEPNLRVHFLLSIREDAWAKLDRFEGRIPGLFANYVRVDHLDRDAARSAIEGPLARWNSWLTSNEQPYSIDATLVDAVIDAAAVGRFDVSAGRDGSSGDDADGEAVEAPFLQLVMERLWRATIAVGSNELTLARLQQLGGAHQIVENHLLEALNTLTRPEQSVAADAFRFLVTRSNTKIAHSASDLAEWTRRGEAEVAAVLDRLCQPESGRILRAVSSENEARRYELFHDVLAEPVADWRRAFEQERARRETRRRFGRITVGLLALVLGFALLGGLAVHNGREAVKQRNEARRAGASVASLALASAADSQLDSSPATSLLFGLEANQASQSSQARDATIAALERIRRPNLTLVLRHPGPVRVVAFGPSGRMVAVGGEDGNVWLWDIRARKKIAILRGHTDVVESVDFSPDGHMLASSGLDRSVRLWDVRKRKEVAVLRGNTQPVYSVAFSPDGRTLASGSLDGRVRLWDVRRLKPLAPFPRSFPITSVAFSPNGRSLAAGGDRGKVSLWSVGRRRLIGIVGDSHDVALVYGVAYSPDGRTLAYGMDDGRVRLWNVRVRKRVAVRHASGGVRSIAFSPKGDELAAGTFAGTVQLWDTRAPRPRPIATLRGHTGFVAGVAFSPDGRTLASSSDDGTARLWDTRGGGERRVVGVVRESDVVGAVAFSPDGRTLAVGSGKTVRLSDVGTGRPTGTLPGSVGNVVAVAFSPDRRTLASAGLGVQVWDMRRGVSKHVFRIGRAFSVAFSPDGRLLASGNANGTTSLWDVRTWKPVTTFHGQHGYLYTGGVNSVAFSPDGSTLAAGNYVGTVWLWDLRTRSQRPRAVLRGLISSVEGVAFSPDGHTVAAGSRDHTVRLWDVRGGKPLSLAVLHGHSGGVDTVAFSPDGQTLASAGLDETVRLWNAHTRRSIAVLHGHAGAITSLAFSPDGRTLASGSDDHTVRLWEGIFWRGLDELTREVCGLVAGNLTAREWAALAPGVPYHTTCPG